MESKVYNIYVEDKKFILFKNDIKDTKLENVINGEQNNDVFVKGSDIYINADAEKILNCIRKLRGNNDIDDLFNKNENQSKNLQDGGLAENYTTDDLSENITKLMDTADTENLQDGGSKMDNIVKLIKTINNNSNNKDINKLINKISTNTEVNNIIKKKNQELNEESTLNTIESINLNENSINSDNQTGGVLDETSDLITDEEYSHVSESGIRTRYVRIK